MNLSGIAIRRPVFMSMVALFLMVLGGIGLSKMGTERFPDVSFPVVVVNITYPGASPNEVEQLVTKPIEDAVVSVNGLDRLQSQSREGVSTVIILFKLETDVKQAAIEVREKVAQVRYRLPTEAKEPSIARYDMGATPVLTYTLSGGGRSLDETQKFAKDVLKPALEQVEGVATVTVQGGADREVKVQLDLAKIDALHLSPLAVLASLKTQNLNVPAGHYDEGSKEVSVRTIGEFKTVEDIRNAIVAAAPDGSNVRLRDVAQVEDGSEESRTKIRVNGEPAVTFSVIKQSGTNTVGVSDDAKAKLATLEKNFPPGIKSALIVEEAKYIRENAHEVEIAIFFGGGMAILVILIFMLDIRSTLISAVALPTSVVSTFFVMWLFKFTFNMMTLLALSLAIGLLIDDAVVVRENISKHLERGVDPRKAAEEGTKEISLSVLATTLTIVAVFVPVAFMSGMVGQFFRQFGITICAAVVMSLFVAFTLDPMLSSRFSKAHVKGAVDPYARIKAPFLKVFEANENFYRRVLRWAVTHKLAVVLLGFGSCAGGCATTALNGSDFVNQEDRSQFVVNIEFPSGQRLEETARLTYEAETELVKDKRFTTVFSTIGVQGEINKVQWRVLTLPKSGRKEGINALKDVARQLLVKLPNAEVTVTDPPFVEGAIQDAQIMVQLRGSTYDDLAPLSRKFQGAMKGIPGMADVKVRYNPGAPELQVSVDRDKAARAGIPVATIAMAVRTAIEGDEAGKLRQGKDEIPIKVRLSPSDRASADDVLRMTMWTPNGPVSLRDLAVIDRGEGPNVIEREARERKILVTASTNGRSVGELAKDMQAAFDKIPLPPGSSWHFDGQIKDMNESNTSFLFAFAFAIVLIYIVLAAQFESLIHPVTIMVSLPLAFVGAFFALFGANVTLAMGSIIGMILLMGLVTKNAILLVDRAIIRVREHGETPLHAIQEAGPERLRPILMTSAAMILGMLPTALSNGEGSEFRAPMAIAVIGGVISSTLLSLVVVPVFYLLIEGLRRKVRGTPKSEGHPLGDANPAPAE
jgi:hydrophobic/amphiphilic exporter-1 (mainly G- bacteria), HAE1 family